MIQFAMLLTYVAYCETMPPKPFPGVMKTESEFRATENLFKEKVAWVQENPHSSNVMMQLKDLYTWVGAAPYVKAAHNTRYIPGFMENKKQYAKFDVLFWEYTYAQIACSFDAKANDSRLRCIEAGLKSMIACYRNICMKDGNPKWEFMENYISNLTATGIPNFLKGVDDSIKNAKSNAP
ncbi:MAG TPA: hypothetical protein PKO15_11635 [Fibrobacteria bacterium]|nr:hypothetical protein [Fibrobacteria bacterium]